MDDRTDPTGFDDGPNEVGNARHGHEVGLDRKQVPDLMDGKPDGRQAACPEKEEAEKVPRIGSGACRHAVGKIGITRPDRSKHECDTLPFDMSDLPFPDFPELGLGSFARYIPPIHDCTPYHIQAIAARLNTGQSEPQMPNDARVTTGKLMWYVAPIRPVMQMNVPDMV